MDLLIRQLRLCIDHYFITICTCNLVIIICTYFQYVTHHMTCDDTLTK